jgi:DNA polymerase-3 subunit delta
MARRGKPDPFSELQADVRSGELKPVYVLFGQEPFLLRQAYDALFAASVQGGPRGFNEQVFQADKISGDEVASACKTLPMMGPRRTIVVRSINKLKKDAATALGEYCSSPSPTSCLILLADDDARKAIDGRSKLAKQIKKHGRWCEFKRLYGRNLHGWIEREAGRHGKKLDRAGAGYLEALTGGSLSQIANNLTLASLFVGEKPRIDLSDLEEVCAGSKQDALWSLLDALGERRLEPAIRNAQLLWKQGEQPFGVLSLAKRRVDQLHAIERARDRGASPRDAMLAAGVAPNMAWKWEKQLGRYRLPELRRAGARMLRAESELKGGLRVDARWIVEGAIRDVIRG